MRREIEIKVITKLNNKHLPLTVRIKKYKMLFNYHVRDFWKRVFANLPTFLFGISLVMFFLVLIPNIMHRFPIFGEWPRVLKLQGTVSIETNEGNSRRLTPLTGAVIEIGGYKSLTDQEGKFYLKFVSKSSINIPVIVQWANNHVVKRVSFEPNLCEKTEVFVLNGN